MKTNAQKMLDNARINSPDRPEGTSRMGRIIVTWHRPERVYDVGTAAQELARGPRATVLPVLEKMIAEGA